MTSQEYVLRLERALTAACDRVDELKNREQGYLAELKDYANEIVDLRTAITALQTEIAELKKCRP